HTYILLLLLSPLSLFSFFLPSSPHPRYLHSFPTRRSSDLDRVCAKLGFGVFDKESKTYSGLIPHDFRRSAARNLIKAGLDRRTAMKITGHKTEHIFERYNIKTTTDVQEALIKAGTFKKSATVVPIAETSATL